MKSNIRLFVRSAALCVAVALGITTALGQTTATYTNQAGGEWNTALNWDSNLVPNETVNAVLSTNTAAVGSQTVTYDLPMAAGSILSVSNKSAVLVINTNGFTVGAGGVNAGVIWSGGRFLINSGGVVNFTNGGLTFTTNGAGSLAPGGTLNVSGTLSVGLGGNNSTGGGQGNFTNNGGTFTVGTLNVNNGTGNQNAVCVINGGTNTIGTLNIGRSALNPFGNPGPEGLLISNGLVTIGSINLGGNPNNQANSYLTMQVAGGVVSNTASMRIHNVTAGRHARFLQTSGRFVAVDPLIITNDPSLGVANYTVIGGTNIVGGFSWGWLSNGVALGGTINFTNAANVFLGGGGIVSNGAVVLNCTLATGGRFGAYLDWTNFATLTMANGSFDCEDYNGTPHNIYSAGLLRGAGSMTKSGPGTLTLAASNTYTGNTIINAGVLAVVNDGITTFGSIGSSLAINLGSGGTLDISQAPSFVLGAGKTITGSGTVVGAFAASDTSIITPGGAGAQGTLTFSNGLAATNVTLNYELTDNPSGLVKSNDAIRVSGNLVVSGTNTFIVLPVGSLAIGTYKLITYTGSLVGSLANFNVATNTGTLINPPGEIDLVVTTVRPVANLIWRGDGTGNLWDTGTSSNWLNGASRDRFYTGDTNTFNDTATNFTVNVSGTVLPASFANVVFDATNDYTLAGDGTISGTTGLTKTNSDRLTITATNSYTGVTTISGGTLSVATFPNSTVNGPIGAATASSGNIVLNNTTLEYTGSGQTSDRGMTLLNNVVVNLPAVTLTVNGSLTGSGVLTKVGNGILSLGGVSDYTGGTVINSGTVRPNQGNSVNVTAFGTNTIRLNGTNSYVALYMPGDQNTINNPIVVQGTMNYLTNGGNNTISGLSGSGILTLDGATLSFTAGDMSGYAGTLYCDNLANFRFFGPNAVNLSAATIDMGANVCLLNSRNGGAVIQIGALYGTNNSRIQGASSADAQTTYIIGAKNLDMTYGGSITELSAPRKVNLIKTGTGTLTLSGTVAIVGLDPDTFLPIYAYTNVIHHSGSTVVSNGVLTLVAPAALSITTNVTLAVSGAVLDVSQEGNANPGDNGATLIFTGYHEAVSGQTVAGIGTIRGGLVTDAGSTLNPGLPGAIGILTVTNSVTLGGTTFLKLSHSGSPNSDRLVSSTAHTITYGGSLVVSNSGAALTVNETFTLFSATTLSGTFSSTNLPAGYTWDTSQLGVNGTIRVASINASAPHISTVNLSGGTLTITAGNGNPGDPVSVLSATNILTPLNSWTLINSGSFDGTGNYNTNFPVNPAAPQQYFILRTP